MKKIDVHGISISQVLAKAKFRHGVGLVEI